FMPEIVTGVSTGPLVGVNPLITGRLMIGDFIVRLTEIGAIVAPGAVPLIITGLVPRTASPAVLMVSTEVVPVAGFGLKTAVAPAGNPLTAKFTAPVKFVRWSAMVELAL